MKRSTFIITLLLGSFFYAQAQSPVTSIRVRVDTLRPYRLGYILVDNTMRVAGLLAPHVDGTHDFGSSSLRWKIGWFDSLDVADGLNVGGTLSVTGASTLGDVTVDALTVGRGATVGLNLSVSGLAYVDSILNLVGPVTVDDTLNVLKNLNVTGNTVLTGDLAVNGDDITSDADLIITSGTGQVEIKHAGTDAVLRLNGTSEPGTSEQIQFNVDGVTQWYFSNADDSPGLSLVGEAGTAILIDSADNDITLGGNLLWATDNSKDIGASGANRPRDIFVADDVVAGGDFSTESDVIVTADNGMRAGTSDGSDNSSVKVTGGGGFSVTQGGTDAWYGNEHATLPGVRQITSGNVAGSYIQLSPKGTEGLRVDSAGIRVAKKINTTLVTGFTLASGAITNTGSYSRLDTEGAVALDTLTTINGGTDGDLLILKITSGARDIFVQDGTGNLALAGGTGFLLGDVVDRIVLQYDGAATSWVEISRSDN